MRRNYIKKTLKNGVKLYLYLDKNMKECYVDYMIDYGSSGIWYDFYLDDKLYHVLPGCAHFLEHLLGEHSKYGNFYKYLAAKKYNRNGGTSPYVTHYYFRGVDDILESIKKMIHMVDDPVFTRENVEETKHAIIEETKRTRNNKISVLYCLIERNLYKDLTLYTESLSTIGDEKSTKAITYEMLKTCYDAFYYDENKTLLIAGPLDEKQITDYVENVYSELKPHKKRFKKYEYTNLDKIRKKEEIVHMSTNDDIVSIGFKSKRNRFTKQEVSYYLSFVFDTLFSDSSSFKKKLKDNNILVNINSYYRNFIDDENYFFYYIVTVKDRKRFEKELIKELKSLKCTKKDFDLFIKGEIGIEALSVDKKYNRFNRFSFSKKFTDDFDDIDFLKTLTFGKFLEFYKTLNFDDYSVGIISDNKEK